MRYTLPTLAAVVTGIAIACAALLKANAWIASTAWTLLFLLLSWATVAAILAAPRRRGFWAGFAVVGWLYLVVGIGPFSAYHQGNLLTTASLHWAGQHLPQADEVLILSEQDLDISLSYADLVQQFITARPAAGGGNGGVISTSEPARFFIQVGQTLWTLLLALLGGWFGSFCRRHWGNRQFTELL
jgi:hypothetical protein